MRYDLQIISIIVRDCFQLTPGLEEHIIPGLLLPQCFNDHMKIEYRQNKRCNLCTFPLQSGLFSSERTRIFIQPRTFNSYYLTKAKSSTDSGTSSSPQRKRQNQSSTKGPSVVSGEGYFNIAQIQPQAETRTEFLAPWLSTGRHYIDSIRYGQIQFLPKVRDS